MTYLVQLLLIIMLPTLGLLASPDPASQAASDASIRLATKFAPRFVFAKDEKFGPSTIDWFLSNDILVSTLCISHVTNTLTIINSPLTRRIVLSPPRAH